MIARRLARLYRNAHPSQRRGDEEITDNHENVQHRSHPLLPVRVVRRFTCAGKEAAAASGGHEGEFVVTAVFALDRGGRHANLPAMLQRNVSETRHKAHVAHAAMVGLHTLCCGLPALAMLAAAVSGATSGLTLFARYFSGFHALLHAHEIWILIVSAGLVTLGGVLEVTARRGAVAAKGFPVMFAISVCCFIANAAIIAAHRIV